MLFPIETMFFTALCPLRPCITLFTEKFHFSYKYAIITNLTPENHSEFLHFYNAKNGIQPRMMSMRRTLV